MKGIRTLITIIALISMIAIIYFATALLSVYNPTRFEYFNVIGLITSMSILFLYFWHSIQEFLNNLY